ncbi:hypothetical protein ACU61A_37435 [Pseudonocardia sichuanensis]
MPGTLPRARAVRAAVGDEHLEGPVDDGFTLFAPGAVATLVSGVFVLHLDGPLPWQFALAGALAVIAALPLVAIQSLLSMLLRSFAAPVAICFVGCVIGVATVTSSALRPLSHVVPQAINTRTLDLGSTAIAESGGLTVPDSLPILLTAVALTGIITIASVAALRSMVLR